MSEPVITKRCTKCNVEKPLSEFYKQPKGRDGYKSICKPCCILYNKTEKAKKHQKEYRQTERCRLAHRNYNKTIKGKISRKRYDRSEKGKQGAQRAYKKCPNKRKARSFINLKIHRQKLSPALAYHCRICWTQAEEYHHHLGYEREHWLDITPLCISCHYSTHKATA